MTPAQMAARESAGRYRPGSPYWQSPEGQADLRALREYRLAHAQRVVMALKSNEEHRNGN